MSGHNKWSKIKHKKGAEDAKKSRVFSKLSRLLTSESKKVGGDKNSPSLLTIIEMARKENMPKDTIDRAIQKGSEKETVQMESIIYETYGPGGIAMIIEVLTDNKNRAAADVRHVLSKNGLSLAGSGSATWAFEKQNLIWKPKTFVSVSEQEIEKIFEIIESLEELEDVQNIYNNTEGFEEILNSSE